MSGYVQKDALARADEHADAARSWLKDAIYRDEYDTPEGVRTAATCAIAHTLMALFEMQRGEYPSDVEAAAA